MRFQLIVLLAVTFTAALTVQAQDSVASADAEPDFDVRFPRFSEFTAADAAPAPPASETGFAKGTWTFQAYLSGTYGFDDGDIYLGHVGVGYHILDALSVNIEFIGGYTFEDENNVAPNVTVGFDLLLRLHLLHNSHWSFYVEGGCGMLWFNDEYPAGGTRQNFTPQLGAGFTLALFGEARLMAGVRWHHISNANKSGEDRNPGYDGIMPYAGIMISF